MYIYILQLLPRTAMSRTHSMPMNKCKFYLHACIACRLKWSDVVKPAIKIAKEGFRVTEHTGEVENLCSITDNHRVQ